MQAYTLSGLSGVGKTTAGSYAERMGYLTVSVGETVRQAYDECDGDGSIGAFVERTHETAGRAWFTREAVETLNHRLADREETPDGVVIEGVNSMASVRVVQAEFRRPRIVWIHAPLSMRLRRLRRRDGRRTSSSLLKRDLRELNSGLDKLAAPFGHDYCVRNTGAHSAFDRRLATVFGDH